MEQAEKQSSHFSLKWLLKRGKEAKPISKSLHQNLSDHFHNPKPVRVSKSCDTNLTVCNSKKYTSAFMFGRLLNSRSKSPPPCNKSNIPPQSPFKTSFSSGDVCGLSPPTAFENQVKAVSKSTQNVVAPETSCRKKVITTSDLDRIPIWQMKNSSPVYTMGASVKARAKQESNQSYHLVLCRLCLVMMPSSEMYQLHECGCVFCFMCVQQYLSINIREGNVTLTCPDAECGLEGKIEMTEIKKLVNSDMYEMFQRFKLNRDVELDPNRTWCPRVDCETICYVRNSESSQGIAVHCPNCSLTFCSSCKERWHATKTCEDIRKERKEEEDFLSSDDDESIKRCPKCRVPIERDEGCAQMMCKRCKHVFCWYCLASLDDDFLLRHYDKGPCKNKLGHSRASVAWHRTQVVGIFAGFGLLLLVATPLLVLAAPCLLCCRCKQCSLFEEEAGAH